MAMSLTSKRIHNNSRALQKAPFCSEIRDFISESKRCQTLFANTEAGCKKQVETCKNVNSLKNFIYYTLFSQESDFSTESDLTPEMNPQKLQLAEKVQEKMIMISNRYGLKEEIYFSVVWVYYFEYESKTVGAIPAFKIYKKKLGSEAEFLDLNLRSYASWEHYLCDSDFCESFLCVPRNGEYTSFEETLDLEYLRPLKKSTNSVFRGLKPFSQSAVRPFLNKVIELGKETWERIKCFICTYTGPILKANLCIAWLIINHIDFTNMGKFQTFGKMVLGLSSAVNLVPSTFLAKPELGFGASELTDIDYEMKKLIKLFGSPKKNWDDILLTMGSLLSKSMSVLMEIFNITRLPEFLHNLYMVLRKIGLAKNEKVNYMNKSLEGVNSKGTSEFKEFTFRNYGETSSRVLENRTQKEIFFKNLSRLEEVSADVVEREFEKTSSTTNSLDVDIDNIISPIRVGTTDGKTLYLLPDGTTYDLFKHLQKLTGDSSISLKFESDIIYRITDNSGNIIGSLYFIRQGVAVGVFPSNRVDKNNKQNIE